MQNEPEAIEETLDPQIEDILEGETTDAVDDVAARLAKAEELAHNYKIRAEKAEAKAKVQVQAEDKTTAPELTAKDILAVSKAGIDPEDLDEVIEYANYKRIPIHEALKSSVVKATLAEKDELRKSAQATNTGTVRRSSSSVANARKGIMPDSDTDLARLVKLRRG